MLAETKTIILKQGLSFKHIHWQKKNRHKGPAASRKKAGTLERVKLARVTAACFRVLKMEEKKLKSRHETVPSRHG